MTGWLIAIFLTLQSTLLLLDVWETRRPSLPTREPLRHVTILFLIAVTAGYLVLQVTGGFLVPATADVLEAFRQTAVHWRGQPSTRVSAPAAILICVVLFYTAGFWDYVVHRCFSHSRLFWLTHEYHHLPRQVTVWMPGILARPFGFIPVTLSTFATAATFCAGSVALQLPVWDPRPLLPTGLLIVLVLTASHSAFLRRYQQVHQVLRWLGWTTPQEHLLHHRVNSRCNYGNFTTLWDRLFRTYESPDLVDLDSVPLGLGYDQDFLGTITLGRLRMSAQQRGRYQIGRFCNIDDDTIES